MHRRHHHQRRHHQRRHHATSPRSHPAPLATAAQAGRSTLFAPTLLNRVLMLIRYRAWLSDRKGPR